MLIRWAAGFFVVALIAAVFGYSGLASGLMGIAKFICFIFVVLFVLAFLAHLFRGRGPDQGEGE